MNSVLSIRFAMTLLMAFSLPISNSWSKVKLPGFFGNSMVLQQEKEIRIWGWADSGEKIEVSLAAASASVIADSEGKWAATLPAMKANKAAQTLSVSGSNTITLKDVLIGEVWLCSGQSNMEWAVRSSSDSANEIAAADYPMIRHIKVPKRPSNVALDDITAPWQVCTPSTAGNFTACGYFMARHLSKELDVPIGLINSSWGGTRVEPWTPPIGFEGIKELDEIHQSIVARTPGGERNQQIVQKHIDEVEAWVAKAKVSLDKDQVVDPSPAFPASIAPFESHQDPTMLYNGMIHAMVGFPIRGAIWYQGESNHAEGSLYTSKKKALINGWRKLWGQGDFPFYYVQIAPFQYGKEDPAVLAEFWEAQSRVKEIVPRTDMVVINDIATLDDIHPPNKQDVGLRLAMLALKNEYGRDDMIARNPEMDSMSIEGNQLTLRFKYTGGDLKTRDGKPASHFELIGPGSDGFHPAAAEIQGDRVVLSSPKVTQPTAFRFAWDKLAQPNLTGATGLPVGAMRGGKVPSLLSQFEVDEDYRLVYGLDLAKLGPTIQYDVDNSRSIGQFSRIGYLLGLDSNQHGKQIVFVTMDAFTDDIKKIGIPTIASGADFQTRVTGMEVKSTVAELNTSSPVATGNIEFWPNNYGAGNAAGVTHASSSVYDFGDEKGEPKNGYGSMQVHDFGAKRTIFAINQWKAAARADIGIGSSTGNTRDWTFSGNAASYSEKRLAIYVK